MVYDTVGHFDTTFKYVADHDLLLRAFYITEGESTAPKIWVRMRSAASEVLARTVGTELEVRSAQRNYGIQSSLGLYRNKNFQSNFSKQFLELCFAERHLINESRVLVVVPAFGLKGLAK